MNSLFDNTTKLLTKATHLTNFRHNVIASNIANVDTPGYKAMDLNFEHLLKRALADISNEGGENDTQPVPVLDTTQQPRLDGNTVNVDQQLVKLAENTIMHITFVQLLDMRFKMLQTAIYSTG